MRVLVFDIGGANTKKMVVRYRDEREEVKENKTLYFPMWREWERLEEMLEEEREEVDTVAVTMTAEEADCFTSKRKGVEYILSACDRVIGDPLYLTITGNLVDSGDIRDPLELSAANWVASAYYLSEKYGEGLLVDMGSTTTDIIPFKKGRAPGPMTDLERLRRGRLVYTGFLRTPVGGIVKKVPIEGEMIPISPEFFAQSADVYNVLGCLEDYPCETPDGGEKTPETSMRRVARHLCSDPEDLGEGTIRDICSYIMEAQVKDIAKGIERVHQDGKAYCCGAGRELALKAATSAGLEAVDLSKEVPFHDNLPCLGLARMVRDRAGG